MEYPAHTGTGKSMEGTFLGKIRVGIGAGRGHVKGVLEADVGSGSSPPIFYAPAQP